MIDADMLKDYMCAKCDDEFADEPCDPSDCVFCNAIKNIPTVESVPLNIFEQVKWERDIAVDQLKSIGKGLGEKMDNLALGVPVSEVIKLRNELVENDLITMRGLMRMNQLIYKHGG